MKKKKKIIWGPMPHRATSILVVVDKIPLPCQWIFLAYIFMRKKNNIDDYMVVRGTWPNTLQRPSRWFHEVPFVPGIHFFHLCNVADSVALACTTQGILRVYILLFLYVYLTLHFSYVYITNRKLDINPKI